MTTRLTLSKLTEALGKVDAAQGRLADVLLELEMTTK